MDNKILLLSLAGLAGVLLATDFNNDSDCENDDYTEGYLPSKSARQQQHIENFSMCGGNGGSYTPQATPEVGVTSADSFSYDYRQKATPMTFNSMVSSEGFEEEKEHFEQTNRYHEMFEDASDANALPPLTMMDVQDPKKDKVKAISQPETGMGWGSTSSTIISKPKTEVDWIRGDIDIPEPNPIYASPVLINKTQKSGIARCIQ